MNITAQERFLTYSGDADYALRLVHEIQMAFFGTDMPKMLNDFIFNIEVALQDAGVLDEDFNEVME
jgi:hypothetical protein